MRVVAIVICQNHVPDLVQLSAHEPQMGSRTASRPITQRMFEYRVSLRYSNVAFGNHVPMGFNGGKWGIFLSHVWGHRRVAAWGYYWQDNEDHINDFFDEPQAGEENSRVGLKDGFLGWKNTHGLKKPWTFSGLIIMEYLGICLSTRYTPELQFEWENMWSFSASFIWDYPVFSQAGSDEYLNKPTHSYGGWRFSIIQAKTKAKRGGWGVGGDKMWGSGRGVEAGWQGAAMGPFEGWRILIIFDPQKQRKTWMKQQQSCPAKPGFFSSCIELGGIWHFKYSYYLWWSYLLVIREITMEKHHTNNR